MSQRRTDAPLIVTAVFVLLVALLTTGVLPSPIVVAEVQCSGEYAPPNLGYDDCKRTQTAQAAGPTATNAPGGGGAQQAPTNTPTATATLTPTATAPAATGTLAPTTPTATRPPAQVAVAPPTPTPTLPAGVPALICLPGTTVTLAGQAAPLTQLLAFFGDRPVGGGFSRADGSYSIDLLIGAERPGLYLVEVRERDGLSVVSQVGCEVPGAFQTPTPTLDLRG